MLDLREEEKFAELKDKCRELKVVLPPEIMIGLQVHDKNGELLFDDIQRGHSWTRNYYNAMFSMAANVYSTTQSSFGASYMSGKNSGGTVRGSDGYNVYPSNGFYGDATGAYGIVVGTDETPFSADQYILIAKIANGTGSGQFSHTTEALGTFTYTGGTKTWKATCFRIFNNNSGEAITVKETGLYWQGRMFSSSEDNIMFERSVLDPTVSVPNGAQLTVTYDISMDFTAID